MKFSETKWSLYDHNPRDQQIEIINEILTAMDKGYKNIILEAGTGVGKSAIATTIANYVENSYIITMTNQLLQQYLHDFDYMIEEIKGRANYTCNYGGNCKECQVVTENQKRFQNYVDALKQYEENPGKYTKPQKPEKMEKCGEDCPYSEALKMALSNKHVITNYDFLHYAGNYAGIMPERKLLILDEAHNLEKKVMQLVVKTFNRKTIYKDYNFDIFDGVAEHQMTLKSIQQPGYWINISEKIIKEIKTKLNKYVNSIGEMSESEYERDDIVKEYSKDISKYNDIIKILKDGNWIIETPTKKEILADDTYLTRNKEEGLKAYLKPLTIADYTNDLLHFGETRLFMTGTLGNKNMFCKWIGVDPNETYYIYKKSPFPVENRRIIKDYAGKMSGRTNGEPNWKSENAMIKIHDILDDHKGEKGVIHVSSNAQAWWVLEELRPYSRRWFKVAYGRNREQQIQDFEDNDRDMVLIGAGIKDGVDFKGDKCRFQIIFKMPFPSLAGTQVNIRKRFDNTWYIYQTIMPLMQAYGRGIRDMEDYCVTYVLDSDFDNLLDNYSHLFNEYFLEAIEGYVPKQKKIRRVKRVRARAK